MEENIIEILEELKDLNKKYTEKTICDRILSISPEDYAKDKCENDESLLKEKPIEPEKNIYYKEKEAPKKFDIRLLIIEMIVYFWINSSLFIDFFKRKEISKLTLPAIGMIAIAVFNIITLKATTKDYKDDISNYEKNIEYMQQEYPKLLNEYNKKNDIFNEKYDRKYSQFLDENKELKRKTKEKLELLNNSLYENTNLVPTYYYDRINDLIQIIQRGRATSVKEALNVLEDDDYRKRLIEEKKEQNRLLREQQLELQRHNEEMEYEARLQRRENEKIRKEEEKRERQRQKNFDEAATRYKKASFHYNHSNSNSALDYKTDMDSAYADMLKYKD